MSQKVGPKSVHVKIWHAALRGRLAFLQLFAGASALPRKPFAASRKILSRLDAGADEREGEWLMRQGNAYKYASKFEDAAFLLEFGSICAACGGLLVFKM